MISPVTINKMVHFGTKFSVIFVVSVFISITAAEIQNPDVNEVRELLRNSLDYQNWCSKCRVNGTRIDTDLYINLCYKFDANMMDTLEKVDVNLTSRMFFAIFMDEKFCLNATAPSVPKTNTSYHPRTYITVLSDLPGWNDTQHFPQTQTSWKGKVIQNRQGYCPLYWIIPLVAVVVILIVGLGVTYFRYRATKPATSNQTTEEEKQVEAGTVFNSIDNL